jgi:hypothetical protein
MPGQNEKGAPVRNRSAVFYCIENSDEIKTLCLIGVFLMSTQIKWLSTDVSNIIRRG